MTIFSGKKSCLSPCPKRIRPLIKPLLKNSFSTNFQGTGPWKGPVHFSRFVLRVHICSKLFQSWSWSQEKTEQPFTKTIEKFKVQAFPKRIRPLIKPLLKNSFSANFKGTGPWEGPIHFSRLFSGFTFAANFSRSHPGATLYKSNRFFMFTVSFFFFVSFSFSCPFSFSFPSSFSFPASVYFIFSLSLSSSSPSSSSLSLFLFLFQFLFLFLFVFLFLSLSLFLFPFLLFLLFLFLWLHI